MIVFMVAIEDLEKRIAVIEQRNRRVEHDKAWEVSWARRGVLIVFTYCAVWFYLQAIAIENAWLNAIVPAGGFLLSTLTLPWLKKMWIRRKYGA